MTADDIERRELLKRSIYYKEQICKAECKVLKAEIKLAEAKEELQYQIDNFDQLMEEGIS
jgi:hypothetical protein